MDPSRRPGVVCRGYAKLCRTSPVMDNGSREYNETVSIISVDKLQLRTQGTWTLVRERRHGIHYVDLLGRDSVAWRFTNKHEPVWTKRHSRGIILIGRHADR